MAGCLDPDIDAAAVGAFWHQFLGFYLQFELKLCQLFSRIIDSPLPTFFLESPNVFSGRTGKIAWSYPPYSPNRLLTHSDLTSLLVYLVVV